MVRFLKTQTTVHPRGNLLRRGTEFCEIKYRGADQRADKQQPDRNKPQALYFNKARNRRDDNVGGKSDQKAENKRFCHAFRHETFPILAKHVFAVHYIPPSAAYFGVSHYIIYSVYILYHFFRYPVNDIYRNFTCKIFIFGINRIYTYTKNRQT